MLPFSNKYLTDEFSFKKAALMKVKAPLDFTDETSVNGLEIVGTEPEGTRRRVIFEIDGALYKFVNGALDEYEGYGGIVDILEMGNTVGELLQLEKITGFVGKKVYPIVALEAPADAPVMPRIKISAKVQSFNDVYTCYRISPEYKLTDLAKVIRVVASKEERGYGKAKVECRLKRGEWGDWNNLEDAWCREAEGIQFRAQYILSAIDGSDYAAVKEVRAEYTTDAGKVTGGQEIICAAQEYDADLGTCYALINHSRLMDCELKAYVKFEKALERRENEPIAGYLAHNGVVDKGIVQDSLHVEVDGLPIDRVYYDTESGSVTVAGESVTASYECGLMSEDWREMTRDYARDEQTRFTYRLKESGWRISAVRFRFERLSGTVEKSLGIGSGKVQYYALEHEASEIECNAPYIYDGILRVLGSAGVPIELRYNYEGRIPVVKDYIIGWKAGD